MATRLSKTRNRYEKGEKPTLEWEARDRSPSECKRDKFDTNIINKLKNNKASILLLVSSLLCLAIVYITIDRNDASTSTAEAITTPKEADEWLKLPNDPTYEWLTFEFALFIGIFIILPLLVLLVETVRPQNGTLHRCITGSFLLSLVMNHAPAFISKLCAILLVTLCGLITTTRTHAVPTMKNISSELNLNRAANGWRPPSPDRDPNNIIHGEDDDENVTIVPASRNRIDPKYRATLAVLVLAIVMVIENFFIFVVSYANGASHAPPYPAPLQDNGQLIMQYVFETYYHLPYQTVQDIRDLINIQWALVCAFGVALLLLDLGFGIPQSKSIWSVSCQALLTLSCVRFIRTVSFALTVIPSQTEDCFYNRFGLGFDPDSNVTIPVPEFPSADWWMEGFTPRVDGGCNDLIISGHATITSVLGCVTTSFMNGGGGGNKPRSSSWGWGWGILAIWLLLSVDFAIEVYQGYHYSVDMFLGMMLTRLIFGSFSEFGVEEEYVVVEKLNRTSSQTTSFSPLLQCGSKDIKIQQQQQQQQQPLHNVLSSSHWLSQITKIEAMKYCIPSAIAFWIAAFSTWNVNIFILLYAGACVVAFRKQQENYAKHLALCLMYIALISFL